MTFNERMTAETHAPMPRFLYLLDKPCHTLAIAVVLHALGGVPAFTAAVIALVLYVGIGLGLWYRKGIPKWWGPGSFMGDLMYHTFPSLAAPVLLSPLNIPERWALAVLVALLWWTIEGMGYGVVRDSV